MLIGLKLTLNRIINELPNPPTRKFKPDELALKLKKEENGIKPKLIKITYLEDELPSPKEPNSRSSSISLDSSNEMTEDFLPISRCRNVSINSLLSYQSEKDQQEDLEFYVDKDSTILSFNSKKAICKENKQKESICNHKTLATALLFLGVATLVFALAADMPILLAASTVFVLSSFTALCVGQKFTTIVLSKVNDKGVMSI